MVRAFRIGAAASVLALTASLVGTAAAQTSTAYTTRFATAITYQNVGTGTANLQLDLYPEGSGSPTTITGLPQLTLAPGAGTSLAMGAISSLASGFKGAGILSSDEPVVATMVQLPIGSLVKNRPLSNGFSPDEGAAKFLIATTLKAAFESTTQFSVQNIDSVGADLTIQFFDATSTPPGTLVTAATQTVTNLPAGSVKYFDLGTISTLPNGFNGSAIITSKKTGTATDGRVVATALELSTTGLSASSFEGVAGGANTVYMPAALCQAFTPSQTSIYAIQNVENAGGAVASVTVTYKYRPAISPTAAIQTLTTPAVSIAPGGKSSFNACLNGLPAGSTGSATITSTGGKIVGIAKVQGGGFSTAAPGAIAGAAKLAFPYVRTTIAFFDTVAAGETSTRQRTSIAIQNVGAATIPAGALSVKYIDRNGAQVGSTFTNAAALPSGEKFNSNPTNAGAAANEFGAYGGGAFGGSALVECTAPGCTIVGVARVATRVNAVIVGAEDYNGIPVN